MDLPLNDVDVVPQYGFKFRAYAPALLEAVSQQLGELSRIHADLPGDLGLGRASVEAFDQENDTRYSALAGKPNQFFGPRIGEHATPMVVKRNSLMARKVLQ